MGDPTKYHPLTGALIVPLGYRKNGRAIWPIMGGDDTVPPASPPADPKPSDPPPADPPTPQDPPAKQPPWGSPENFDAEKAWELIQNLRAEKSPNADLQREVDNLKSAQQQQMDAIAKALGLKQDDAPPDPDALAAQVTAEQAKARESAVQLAVYRNAAANEANADALLDSASFLRSLADIDPANAEAVNNAIKTAVEANPLLKATSPTPPTPPFPGGPRTPAPTRAGSLGEAIANKIAAGKTH